MPWEIQVGGTEQAAPLPAGAPAVPALGPGEAAGKAQGAALISPSLHLLQKLGSLNLTKVKSRPHLGYHFRLLLLEWTPIKLPKWLWHPWGSVLMQEQYFYCRCAPSLELQVLQPATSVSVSTEALALFGAVYAPRAEQGDCLTAVFAKGQMSHSSYIRELQPSFLGRPTHWHIMVLATSSVPSLGDNPIPWQHGCRLTEPS